MKNTLLKNFVSGTKSLFIFSVLLAGHSVWAVEYWVGFSRFEIKGDPFELSLRFNSTAAKTLYDFLPENFADPDSNSRSAHGALCHKEGSSYSCSFRIDWEGKWGAVERDLKWDELPNSWVSVGILNDETLRLKVRGEVGTSLYQQFETQERTRGFLCKEVRISAGRSRLRRVKVALCEICFDRSGQIKACNNE